MSPAKLKISKELSKDKRLDLAIKEYKKVFVTNNISENLSIKKSSVRLITREYNLIYITVLRRVIDKT